MCLCMYVCVCVCVCVHYTQVYQSKDWNKVKDVLPQYKMITPKVSGTGRLVTLLMVSVTGSWVSHTL